MNYKLLEALRRPSKEISKEEILHMISVTGALDNELIEEVTQDAGLVSVINLAAAFVAMGSQKVAEDTSLEGRWERLYGASAVNENLAKIVNMEPGISPFTQAVMAITIALMKGD